MDIMYTDDVLLDFLSGNLSDSREQEIVERMQVSADLHKRVDALSSAPNLSRIQKNLGLAAQLPPLDPALAKRLYDVGPGGRFEEHSDGDTTFHEPDGVQLSSKSECDDWNRSRGNWLDEYELFDEIGSGATGVIYRARHRRLNRMAAVKVLSMRFAGSPSAIRRFHREMDAVGTLDHPNIVRAQHAGEANGRHYLAMDYVECRDLVVVAQTIGQMSVGDACAVAAQCAQGLQHAHLHNIVHRDIKPSNLLLTNEGLIKIADFGLAKLRGPQRSGRNWETVDRHVLGTPDFMAPEQMDDSRNVQITADIYSLGCTLFFLLTGKAPHSEAYDDGGLVAMVTAKQNQKPASAGSYRADLPDKLLDILDKMVAPLPQDRYATPEEVCDALAEFSKRGDLRELWSNVAKLLPAKPFDVVDDMIVNTSTAEGTSATVAYEPLDGESRQTDAVAQGGDARNRKSFSRIWRWVLTLLAVAATSAGVVAAISRNGTELGENQSEQPAVQGTLMLTIEQAGASVLIDGKPFVDDRFGTESQIVTVPLPLGNHEIVVQKDGFRVHRQTVDVRRDKAFEMAVRLTRSSIPTPPPKHRLSPAEIERRAIAELLLESGVKLTIVPLGGLPRPMQAEKDCLGNIVDVPEIPAGPFKVTELECYDIKSINDDTVKKIYKLIHLDRLSLRQTNVTGAGLEGIGRLKNLRALDLWSADIRDDELKHLTALESLRAVVLQSTGITDSGLETLGAIKRLERLKIGSNPITDQGIPHLLKMPFLVHVGLDHTQVSENGLRMLSESKSLKTVFVGKRSDWKEGAIDRLQKLRPKPRLQVER